MLIENIKKHTPIDREELAVIADQQRQLWFDYDFSMPLGAPLAGRQLPPDCSEMDLSYLSFEGCAAGRVTFADSNLTSSWLEQANFKACEFAGANLRMARLGPVDFEYSTFRGTDFKHAHIDRWTKFSGCIFEDCHMSWSSGALISERLLQAFKDNFGVLGRHDDDLLESLSVAQHTQWKTFLRGIALSSECWAGYRHLADEHEDFAAMIGWACEHMLQWVKPDDYVPDAMERLFDDFGLAGDLNQRRFAWEADHDG